MTLPVIELTRYRRIDATNQLRKAKATDDDYLQVIDYPCILKENGKTAIVYDDAPEDTAALLEVCKRIKYSTADRTDGMISRSRTFGFQPRIPIRRNFCSTASLTREDPVSTSELFRWGSLTSRWMAQHAPSQYAAQLYSWGRVLPCWKIPASVWTSGIVNWTNPLPYHCDRGNFLRSWNAMVVMSKGVQGGKLVMPGYGIAFDFAKAPRPRIITFDGSHALHGVSPIYRFSEDAYRYSVVWYALNGLSRGLQPEAELARIRVLKTHKEQARHAGGKANNDPQPADENVKC